MAWLEGMTLGSCHIIRRIAAGGMGEVYLAEQPHLGRQVAVKVIRGALDSASDDQGLDTQAMRRFTQEARAIAALEHPNILPLYEYGEQDDIHYLVTPYIADGSLADALAVGPRHRLNAPLPIPLALSVIRQCADALQYAHDRGTIHRDVKPHNMLIRLSPSSGAGAQNSATPPAIHIWLADFGLARFFDELSSQTAITGTPMYCSPEQFRGRPVFATDLYALGCVAYLLLTGRHVFRGSVAELYHQHLSIAPVALSQVNPALPPDVDTVVLRALAKDETERFPRVEQFAEALTVALSEPHIERPAQPYGVIASPATPVQRRALPQGFSGSTAPLSDTMNRPIAAATETESELAGVLAFPRANNALSANGLYTPPAYAPTAPPGGRAPEMARKDASMRPRSPALRRTMVGLVVAVIVASLGIFAFTHRALSVVGQTPGRSTGHTVPTAAPQPTATLALGTPPGFKRITGFAFSLAYPIGWMVTSSPVIGAERGHSTLLDLQPATNVGYPQAQVESSQLTPGATEESLFQEMGNATYVLGPETTTTFGGVAWLQRSDTEYTLQGQITEQYIVCIHHQIGYVIHIADLTAEYPTDDKLYFRLMLDSFAFTS